MTYNGFGKLVVLAAAVAVLGAIARAGAAAPPPSEVSQKPAPAQPPLKDGSSNLGASIAARFAEIRAEFDAASDRASIESDQGKNEFESWKIYVKLAPDVATFSRRVVDLAASAPDQPAARDALLWVLNHPGRGPSGPYNDEFTRAVLLLLRHHADDVEVARMGLGLSHNASFARDMFFEEIYVRTKGREARGLASMALAQYREVLARYAEISRKTEGAAATKMRFETYDEHGALVEKEQDFPPEVLAYRRHLRTMDPALLRSDARRLFQEVIQEYADIPYVTPHARSLEELLKQPNPTSGGKPLTPEDRNQIERVLARRTTLASVARDRIDEMENLVVGKPAPAIAGTDMAGKARKLEDYRGKVVVLVFWGTWCGPCMAEIPHERKLVERNRDRPFAMLGVDCDSDKTAALKAIKDEQITWPNWNDGDPGEGPIGKAYHIRGYPSTFVIDATGLIRHINAFGAELDKAVDDLIQEIEARSPATKS